MKDSITVDAYIHFGKPCITETRIPVLNVLELVWEGLSFDNIIRDYYPDLDVDDIRACIRYAIDVITAEDIRISGSA
jgi:uncharacterized protein (DUF433 family)